MKKIALLVTVFAVMLTLTACQDSNPCGEGTTLVGEECVLDENLNNGGGNQNPIGNGEVSCTTETGLHSVPGGKTYTISSWLNWTFIGGHLVRTPDAAWIPEFGAAVFDVHTVAPNAWEGSFTTSGMFLTEGCEYVFEFTLRTEAPNIKPNVIVFGESTGGTIFFEELVPLTTDSKTFRFVVTPTESNWASTGVYFANSTGMVIIEEIQVERYEIGTNE